MSSMSSASSPTTTTTTITITTTPTLTSTNCSGLGCWPPSIGNCEDLHNVYPEELAECAPTYMNGLFSVVLFAKFLDVLSKMARNNRRAVAGYTKNTVSIDVHIRILEGLVVWCIMWGLYSYLDVCDTEQMEPWKIVADGMVYSISAFFETVILFLLCSSSIGINAFQRSYTLAFALSSVLFILFLILGSNLVEATDPNSLIGIRYIITSVLYVGGYIHSKNTAPERQAITKYVLFVVPLSIVKAVGRFLIAGDYSSGYCVYDFSKLVFYMFYPPIVYIALKRDSQYWTEDTREETNLTTSWRDDLQKTEIPNYEDVVIPKTELYFQTKVSHRMDTQLQLHLWRRKIVFVKVFQMDFLTRDSITNFKYEANAMRKLRHENIVRFMGVVIDPPSMCIVMEYCSNGDLFNILSKLRKSYDRKASEQRQESFSGAQFLNSPSTFPKLQRMPSAVYYRTLEEDEEDVYATAAAADNRTSGISVNTMSMSKESSPSFTEKGEKEKEKDMFSPFQIIKQIGRGMKYLHSSDGGQQAHRDLKSLNILLTNRWVAKIADFGECINVGKEEGDEQRREDICGTPAWAAPEVLNNERATLKSDVYSFAVVMWEIMTWNPPMVNLPKTEMERELKRKKNSSLKTTIESMLGLDRKTSGERTGFERSKNKWRMNYSGFGGLGGGINIYNSHNNNSNNTNNDNSSGRKAMNKRLLLDDYDDMENGGGSSGRSSVRSSFGAFPERESSTGSSGAVTNKHSLDSSLLQSPIVTHQSIHSSCTSFDATHDDGLGGGGGWGVGGNRGYGGIGAGGNQNMSSDDLVGLGGREQDVVIKFGLEDLGHVTLLVAHKMYRPPLLKAPRMLMDLMERCWCQNPDLRPDFVEVCAALEVIEREFPDIDSNFPFEMANMVNYARDDDILESQKLIEEERKRRKEGNSAEKRGDGTSSPAEKNEMVDDVGNDRNEKKGLIGQIGNIIGGEKGKNSILGSSPVVLRSPIPPSPRPTKDYNDLVGSTTNSGPKMNNATGNSRPPVPPSRNRQRKDDHVDDDMEEATLQTFGNKRNRPKTGSF